jgi:hypothetical protein
MGTAVASWYRSGGNITPHEVSTRYQALALATVQHVPSD